MPPSWPHDGSNILNESEVYEKSSGIFGRIIVGGNRIGRGLRTHTHVPPEFAVQSLFATIAGNRSPNLATALQESDCEGFITSVSSLSLARAGYLVLLARESADESFIHFF